MAKKAETLYVNLQGLIKRVGIERVGFLTLTFRDHVTGKFEAQRRFNSFSTNVLRAKHLEFVAVPERQISGRFHFHLVTVFPWDIRTGFDFTACSNSNACKRDGNFEGQRRWERIYFKSANKSLREWWSYLRDKAPKYKFGRCETLPVLSNAAALSRYVGSYVTTANSNRRVSDKGMRTIRYSLASRCASIRWSWADGNGRIWRRGMQILGAITELEYAEIREKFGEHWGYRLRNFVCCFGENYEKALEYVSKVPEWADFRSRCGFVVRLYSELRGEAFPSPFAGDENCPF